MKNLSNFFNNPMIQFLKNSNNPTAAINDILKNNMGENPLLNNIFNLSNQGNANQIEQIARNLCKERGLDADELYKQISQNFTKH